jgi:hypothetical protein
VRSGRPKEYRKPAQARLAELRWEAWKQAYLNRRNKDGTWYYRSLCHFAREQGLDPSVVERVCGPVPRAGWLYAGDWNEERRGYRSHSEMRRFAVMDAKLEHAKDMMKGSLYPPEQYKPWMTMTASIVDELLAYVQFKVFRQKYPDELIVDKNGVRRLPEYEVLAQRRFKDSMALTRKAIDVFGIAQRGHAKALLAIINGSWK